MTAELDHQVDLLRRRLVSDPRAFREVFISEGMQAVASLICAFTSPTSSWSKLMAARHP